MADGGSSADRRAIVLAVVVSTLVATLSWIIAAGAPGRLCYLVPVCPSQVPFGPEECAECSVRARVSAYVWLLVQSGVLTLLAKRYATWWVPMAERKRFATTFGLAFWACSHLSYGLTFAAGEALILFLFGPV